MDTTKSDRYATKDIAYTIWPLLRKLSTIIFIQY